ncbi:restriction endonuclease [Candidatus Micrarchaeota archaeon]|nr:restriction endonuclease [Candidatus Micrarchaeota archaeon]
MKKFHVKKKSGEIEEFNPKKMFRSLIHAGASSEYANEIISKVSSDAYDGIPTSIIFKNAFKLLQKKDKATAMKFTLKDAVYRLGPTGYPFENFIAELFKYKGYSVKKGYVLKGKCVMHEVDVVAEKENEKIMIECKFHSKPWMTSGIQTALYCYARFLDLNDGLKSNKFTELTLVSSTKFSRDVRKYSKCKGINVLGWGYPRKSGLSDMIERKKLYPVTIIESMDNHTISKLLNNDYVLLKDFVNADLKQMHRLTGISETKLKKYQDEGHLIV